MNLRGKTRPVVIEIMPGVMIDQHQIPGIKKRFPRSWKPKLNRNKYKPRVKS